MAGGVRPFGYYPWTSPEETLYHENEVGSVKNYRE